MKFFAWFLILICSGCNQIEERSRGAREWMQPNGHLKVLATTAMINDLLQNIGGKEIDTLTLIQGNLDPHSYQLVKGDDEKLGFADLIFYNGLGLEHGASLQRYLQKNPGAIPLGNLIQEKFPDKILKINNGQVDPHIWMDLSLFSESIPFIVDALSQKDQQHAELYQRRGKALHAQLEQTHANIKQKMQAIPKEKRYLVTSHDAFNYFAKVYLAEPEELENTGWQIRFQAPEGLAPDSQLGSADIQLILNHLKKFNIQVIFPESNVSQDSIRKILNAGKELGIDVIIASDPLYGDAMGSPGSEGDSYPKMLEHNARVIAHYLEPALPRSSSGDKSQDRSQDSTIMRMLPLDESLLRRDGFLVLSPQLIGGKLGSKGEK